MSKHRDKSRDWQRPQAQPEPGQPELAPAADDPSAVPSAASAPEPAAAPKASARREPKRLPGNPNWVRCKALKPCLVRGLAEPAGAEFWLDESQARRAIVKGWAELV